MLDLQPHHDQQTPSSCDQPTDWQPRMDIDVQTCLKNHTDLGQSSDSAANVARQKTPPPCPPHLSIDELMKKRRSISTKTALRMVPEEHEDNHPAPPNDNGFIHEIPPLADINATSTTIGVTGPELEALLRKVIGEVIERPNGTRKRTREPRTKTKARETLESEKEQFSSTERNQHLVSSSFCD